MVATKHVMDWIMHVGMLNSSIRPLSTDRIELEQLMQSTSVTAGVVTSLKPLHKILWPSAE